MSEENENPNIRHYSSEDVARLKKLVQEGVSVMQEIEDLRGGLSDTIKAVAEEVGVKPGQLRKVIATIHKNSLGEQKDKLDEIEDIIETIGYGNKGI